MLTFKKNVTLIGTCTIDGAIAENYRASIDSDNPELPTIVTTPVKKELVYANIANCREDRASFEDYAYGVYEEMVAEEATEETEDEATEETTDETAE